MTEKKLIIQIPCYNEEENLPITLKDLPTSIPGISQIEVVVIDDGSADRTAEVAKQLGVNHLVKFTNHMGLASAFRAGLDISLRLGADIIVNTDADHQYPGKEIPRLIAPILRGEADIVIGAREIEAIRHFSWPKKRLQKLGSWLVRQVSQTSVPDVTSGFRAYSQEAALKLNIMSDYTYTLETIIQAGKKHLKIASVPITINAPVRPSRLIKNICSYLQKSIAIIFRIYATFNPMKVFMTIGGSMFSVGLLIGLRFVYFYFRGFGGGHIQSLILAAILLIIGFLIMMIGLLADLISANRCLVEDTLYRIKKLELETSQKSEKD